MIIPESGTGKHPFLLRYSDKQHGDFSGAGLAHLE
jgi:hypothetical protein